jgi:class 3 adenylate cyclase/tetratricopeptide (TPR) repeat protein
VQRKIVTVVFCDVTGSTALGASVDPEALRSLLARYFERMRAIVEFYGGTVEKFIGDAVMAVFGVPVAHEDDALRAVRAAAEMRDALPALGVQARIGVNTGEVVTGTEERLATGDAVNVAARLEEAAEPGEVLLGRPTLALVLEAVAVEEVEPLALKGKAEPVAAYRLLRVHEPPDRGHESPFVGRQRELALLGEALERARASRSCELVTIVAEAGVGKSRLVAEALAGSDVRVVRGRCLPYGRGITYWPAVEVLKQLDVVPLDGRAATTIRSLLGELEAPTSAEEIAWAVRKAVERAAAERPLAVVFDDVHWAAETFLDLIEHVALLSTCAPILLVCMGRPELLERRPQWPSTLRLQPLASEEVEELIPKTIATGLRERIARAAGGNPLFITEMLAITGGVQAEVVVPPTLRALLTARLDQLGVSERGVLERGAVEGEIFHRGAVQALAPNESQVTTRLAALVRKELIAQEAPQLPGEDGFRFRHLLIRDAAYEALPKANRADLHERFAFWLEDHGEDLVELDEILGYHLEQACRYRAELGLPLDDGLATAARARLAAAGRRALSRWDGSGATALLERASRLLGTDGLDVALELDLVEALFFVGRGADAHERAAALAERGAVAGDRVAELCGEIASARLRVFLERDTTTEQLRGRTEEALPLFEAAGDDIALYTVYRALGDITWIAAQMEPSRTAFERADVHARRAGLPTQLIHLRSSARYHGTTPAAEYLAWLDELDQSDRQNATVRRQHAGTLAMLGRFEEADAILAELADEAIDRGDKVALANVNEGRVDVALFRGDAVTAVRFGEQVCRLLDELGHSAYLSTQAAVLARALCDTGRLDKAQAWATRAAQVGAEDDVTTGITWRRAKAIVAARRGRHAEAERLAREAVALAETTDMLVAQAEAHADLAEVLAAAGRAADAAAALLESLTRYERKENPVMVERTRARLAELQTGGGP